jgi:hypothetical protein
MPLSWSRNVISGSLSLVFPVVRLTRHPAFLIAHHDGLQPTQHEAA